MLTIAPTSSNFVFNAGSGALLKLGYHVGRLTYTASGTTVPFFIDKTASTTDFSREGMVESVTTILMIVNIYFTLSVTLVNVFPFLDTDG
jgi:hypothetical protein